MPKICYEQKRFGEVAFEMIDHADAILTEYQEQGFNLTLRGLYYQFVARDLFPENRRWSWTGKQWIKDPNGTKNADPNYKWLGGLANDGRLGGYLDWQHLEDRTRNVKNAFHWESPSEILKSSAAQYKENKWKGQKNYVEVWIEKDALVGVITKICQELDVPFFSCRGYVSQSEMWVAGQRLLRKLREGHEQIWILHLGDHDPSGIDMSRDILSRLKLFVDHEREEEHLPFSERSSASLVHVRRLALNMSQIEALDPTPPPSPAKLTDARARSYIERYGEDSWELDALEPRYLVDIVTRGVNQLCDRELWEECQAKQEESRGLLSRISESLDDVRKFLSSEANS